MNSHDDTVPVFRSQLATTFQPLREYFSDWQLSFRLDHEEMHREKRIVATLRAKLPYSFRTTPWWRGGASFVAACWRELKEYKRDSVSYVGGGYDSTGKLESSFQMHPGVEFGE